MCLIIDSVICEFVYVFIFVQIFYLGIVVISFDNAMRVYHSIELGCDLFQLVDGKYSMN